MAGGAGCCTAPAAAAPNNIAQNKLGSWGAGGATEVAAGSPSPSCVSRRAIQLASLSAHLVVMHPPKLAAVKIKSRVFNSRALENRVAQNMAHGTAARP